MHHGIGVRAKLQQLQMHQPLAGRLHARRIIAAIGSQSHNMFGLKRGWRHPRRRHKRAIAQSCRYIAGRAAVQSPGIHCRHDLDDLFAQFCFLFVHYSVTSTTGSVFAAAPTCSKLSNLP